MCTRRPGVHAHERDADCGSREREDRAEKERDVIAAGERGEVPPLDNKKRHAIIERLLDMVEQGL